MAFLLVMNQPVGDSLTLSRYDGGQLQIFPQPASSLTISPARTLTGNTLAAPAAPFSPGPGGGAGKLLAVADITPRVSGQLIFEMTFNVQTGLVADQPVVNLEYDDLMTAIVGGTPAPAGGVGNIVLEPTSITSSAPVTVSSTQEVTGTVLEGGTQIATLVMCASVIAVVGHRTGLAMRAFSQANTPWLGMTINISVVELLA